MAESLCCLCLCCRKREQNRKKKETSHFQLTKLKVSDFVTAVGARPQKHWREKSHLQVTLLAIDLREGEGCSVVLEIEDLALRGFRSKAKPQQLILGSNTHSETHTYLSLSLFVCVCCTRVCMLLGSMLHRSPRCTAYQPKTPKKVVLSGRTA